MKTDYLVIAPTPIEEDCAQMGTEDFHRLSQIEIQTFARQLKRAFPEYEAKHCRIAPKSFPHDFGTYWEVYVWYRTDIEESIDYALDMEGETPEHWDAIALAELKEQNYTILPTIDRRIEIREALNTVSPPRLKTSIAEALGELNERIETS